LPEVIEKLHKLICRLNLERVLGRLSNQYFKERPIRPPISAIKLH